MEPAAQDRPHPVLEIEYKKAGTEPPEFLVLRTAVLEEEGQALLGTEETPQERLPEQEPSNKAGTGLLELLSTMQVPPAMQQEAEALVETPTTTRTGTADREARAD